MVVRGSYLVQLWFSCVWLCGSVVCGLVVHTVVHVYVAWFRCGSHGCGMGHMLLSIGSVVVQWYGWHGSDVEKLCVVQWLR